MGLELLQHLIKCQTQAGSDKMPAMETLLFEQGLTALFALSFLAATLVPIGSEWLLVTLILQGTDPGTAVVVATAGNTLGACTTYAIGIFGGPFLMEKVLRITDKDRQRAQGIYQRFGIWSLLLSWVPIVGDPLCLLGGLFRIPALPFVLLVLLGKLGRYAALAALTL